MNDKYFPIDFSKVQDTHFVRLVSLLLETYHLDDVSSFQNLYSSYDGGESIHLISFIIQNRDGKRIAIIAERCPIDLLIEELEKKRKEKFKELESVGFKRIPYEPINAKGELLYEWTVADRVKELFKYQRMEIYTMIAWEKEEMLYL